MAAQDLATLATTRELGLTPYGDNERNDRAYRANVLIGHKEGRSEDGDSVYHDANRVVVIGAETMLFDIDAGADTTAIGYRALYDASGSNNTAMGTGAGDSITTGSNNIIIGKGKQVDDGTGSNQIDIGDRYFYDRIRLLERSADPDAPPEGDSIVWMSDGTGRRDDGDILVASADGITRWATLFDHSQGMRMVEWVISILSVGSISRELGGRQFDRTDSVRLCAQSTLALNSRTDAPVRATEMPGNRLPLLSGG